MSYKADTTLSTLEYPSRNSYNIVTEPLSLHVWFKALTSGNIAETALLWCGDLSTDEPKYFVSYRRSSGTTTMRFFCASVTPVTSLEFQTQDALDEWTAITCVKSHSGTDRTLTIYVSGDQVASLTGADNVNYDPDPGSGIRVRGRPEHRVAEAAIWEIALTATQASMLGNPLLAPNASPKCVAIADRVFYTSLEALAGPRLLLTRRYAP